MKPDLWAVIPVKPFALGKSRLAGVLDAPSRTALNRKLFDHVFGTAVAGLGANRVAVVTSGRRAVRHGRCARRARHRDAAI